VCLILGIAVLLGACQGGSAGLERQPDLASGDTRLTAPTAIQPSGAGTGGFELHVLPDSFLTAGSGAEFSLDVDFRPAGDFAPLTTPTTESGVAVTICARDAVDLRALYCELRYDATSYTAVSVEHLPWAAPADGAGDMLTLEVLSESGVVHLGQVLAHWDKRAGLTGDAQLARVRFAAEPFKAAEHKSVSATALFSDTIKPNLELSITHKRLTWDYYYPGDYNQDGLVGVSDLTPLAQHLGEKGTVPHWEWDEVANEDVFQGYFFAEHSLGDVIDGNHDGWITLNDITLIGRRFGEGIQAFNLYASINPQVDMPRANDELSRGEAILAVPAYSRSGDVRQERTYFVMPFPDLVNGRSYWVRPEFNGQEGTASNAARFDTKVPELLWLELQPETYLEGGSLEEARLEFNSSEDGPIVDIWLQSAELIKFFASELHYDPAFLSPSYCVTYADSSSLREAIGMGYKPEESTPHFLDFRLPGHPSGYVHVWYSSSLGLSGNGYIARIYLLNRPEASYIMPHLPLPSSYDEMMGLHYAAAYSISELSWFYVNCGDYNQDGGVWLDDILQVGRFYGQQVPYFEPDYPWLYSEFIESVIDGNHNGLIEVDDAAVIGRHIGDSVSGYYVYTGLEPLDHPEPVPLGYLSLADAIGDPFNERLQFSFHVDNPVPGNKLWIRPEFNGEIGEVPEGAVVTIPQE